MIHLSFLSQKSFLHEKKSRKKKIEEKKKFLTQFFVRFCDCQKSGESEAEELGKESFKKVLKSAASF